jgi:transcription initiation factor TFIIIB Brf1 subunit/transcription initiation factor TFIIB
MDINDLFCQAFAARPCEVISHKKSCEYICEYCGLSDEVVELVVHGEILQYKAGSRILNEDGLYVCVSCGRSDSQYVSDEPEWNGNADGEGPDMCRVGAPVNTTLYSSAWGASTIISTKGATYAEKRMSRINFHTSMNHKDRSLHHAYEDLDRIGKTVLNLPDSVMLQAKIMYRQFNEQKLTRGAVRTGIKANCITRACSDAAVSRTTQEIARAFNIPASDISRTTDVFKEVIPEKTSTSAVTKPSDLVARIFNDVTCIPDMERGRVRQKVIQACREHEKSPKMMGKTPKGVVSAVMFVTLSGLGFNVDKEEIRRICDVSMPTLNKLEKMITRQAFLVRV